MRAWTQALALACVVTVLTACGGSGNGGVAPPDGGRLEFKAADIDDGSMGSGSLQQRKVVLHNGTSGVLKYLLIQVLPDAHVAQLPLACDASAAAACQANIGGTISIDQLAAGASITLVQRLRIKPGYSGPVSNTWMVTTPDNEHKDQWEQKLVARVADVGLTLQSNAASGADAARTVSYAITLANAGPDEARDVVWTQTAGIDMPLQGVKCTASGGAICPADLGASIKIAQLPKGGSLSLALTYGGRSGATEPDTEMLFSEVRAAGDPAPANDCLLVRLPGANSRYVVDGVYDLIDYEGHVGRLTFNEQPTTYRELRMDVGGSNFLAGVPVDVTGFPHIVVSPVDPTHLITDGTFQYRYAPNPIVGSFNFGQGLKPFLAARDWITDLSELEGLGFTILGSQADAAGKSVDAFARPARFVGGVLSICEAVTPTAVDACPSTQLRQYAAALVGREVELMSSTEVVRLRALRSASGPILVRSERTEGNNGSMFWVGVPQPAQSSNVSSYVQASLLPSTFASETDLAWPTSFGFEVDAQNQVQFSGVGMPNSYLLFFQQHPEQQSTLCAIQGGAQPTGIGGLYEGVVDASSAFGTSPPPCYQGSVYFARTGEMAVLLGKKGGALAGRWLISTY